MACSLVTLLFQNFPDYTFLFIFTMNFGTSLSDLKKKFQLVYLWDCFHLIDYLLRSDLFLKLQLPFQWYGIFCLFKPFWIPQKSLNFFCNIDLTYFLLSLFLEISFFVAIVNGVFSAITLRLFWREYLRDYQFVGPLWEILLDFVHLRCS